MTTVFYKVMILQGEIWCWSLLGLKGLTGLEIATYTVANATNIFSLVTKNSSLVAKLVTRFLYDLELKE